MMERRRLVFWLFAECSATILASLFLCAISPRGGRPDSSTGQTTEPSEGESLTRPDRIVIRLPNNTKIDLVGVVVETPDRKRIFFAKKKSRRWITCSCSVECFISGNANIPMWENGRNLSEVTYPLMINRNHPIKKILFEILKGQLHTKSYLRKEVLKKLGREESADTVVRYLTKEELVSHCYLNGYRDMRQTDDGHSTYVCSERHRPYSSFAAIRLPSLPQQRQESQQPELPSYDEVVQSDYQYPLSHDELSSQTDDGLPSYTEVISMQNQQSSGSTCLPQQLEGHRSIQNSHDDDGDDDTNDEQRSHFRQRLAQHGGPLQQQATNF